MRLVSCGSNVVCDGGQSSRRPQCYDCVMGNSFPDCDVLLLMPRSVPSFDETHMVSTARAIVAVQAKANNALTRRGSCSINGQGSLTSRTSDNVY